jgi:hypothetical protein
MLVTVINPLDNTEVEVELDLKVSLVVQTDKQILNVIGSGVKVLNQE